MAETQEVWNLTSIENMNAVDKTSNIYTSFIACNNEYKHI